MEKGSVPENEIATSSENAAEAITTQSRWRRVFTDPDVRQGLFAAGRTIINTGIAAGDFVPVVGEIGSWGADAIKTANRIAKLFGWKYNFDLTPDVSWKAAILSEAPELLTGGVAPTHILEGTMQLKADVPRMRDAFKKARGILKAEIDDYESNKDDLNQAMNAFGVETPNKEK